MVSVLVCVCLYVFVCVGGGGGYGEEVWSKEDKQVKKKCVGDRGDEKKDLSS